MVVFPPPAVFRLERPRHAVGDARLPPAGCCVADGAGWLLPTGPETYLRIGQDPHVATLQARFRAVVDVSSAWMHFAFAGPNAAELLRKGCAVDLHPRVFPTGACCATGFARMRVVLWRPGIESRYEMLVGRSCALGLWHWLIEAAAQYDLPDLKESLQ